MPTVSSVILRPTLEPYAECDVRLRLAGGPAFRSPNVITDEDIELISDAAGFFSLTLAAGYYWVWLGRSRQFAILVPDTEETYLLFDLRTSLGAGTPTGLGSAGINYRIRTGTLQLLNASTGEWRPVWLAGGQIAVGEADGTTDPVNYRIDGQTLLLREATSQAWHAVYVAGTDPAYQLAVAPADAALFLNYRVLSNRLQLLNPSSGKYHSFYLYGAGNQVALGPAES